MRFYSGISVTPMRKEPSDRSEMVSQLLYGEIYSCEETQNGWMHITNDLDNYEGWIDARTALELDESQVYSIHIDEMLFKVQNQKQELLLPYGSEIFVNCKTIETVNGVFNLPKEFINRKREYVPYKKKIMEDAHSFLNVPYLWGGRSPFGIDCSGFIQVIHKVNGVIFPRDAEKQALMGTEIKFEDREKGDLAFFSNAENKITHVGILYDINHIIHASGWVRKDRFTKKGIHPTSDDSVSHKLAFIKREFIRPESHRME